MSLCCFVDTGLKATGRCGALGTALGQTIGGHAHSLSADTFTEHTARGQEAYYLAWVAVTEAGTRQLRNADFDLQPGMPVTAMIRTPERTLVSYLLGPIREMMAHSMREP